MIQYKEGYKYQLVADCAYYTGIKRIGGEAIVTKYLRLDADGWLHFKDGYAWDGSSGPTIDSPKCMEASLVHDGLCQLMRMGLLNEGYLDHVDRLYYRMCRDNGMLWLQAKWRYLALEEFDFYADPKNLKPIICVDKGKIVKIKQEPKQ